MARMREAYLREGEIGGCTIGLAKNEQGKHNWVMDKVKIQIASWDFLSLENGEKKFYPTMLVNLYKTESLIKNTRILEKVGQYL